MKKLITLILFLAMMTSLTACGGDSKAESNTASVSAETTPESTEEETSIISDSYEDDDIALSNIRLVRLPNTTNGVALLYTIKNKGKDTTAINLTQSKLYQNGVGCDHFSGTVLQEWMDFFSENGIRDTMTSVMTGGEITTYTLYVIDDFDTPILVRFYKGLVGGDLIAEKEFSASDIEGR